MAAATAAARRADGATAAGGCRLHEADCAPDAQVGAEGVGEAVYSAGCSGVGDVGASFGPPASAVSHLIDDAAQPRFMYPPVSLLSCCLLHREAALEQAARMGWGPEAFGSKIEVQAGFCSPSTCLLLHVRGKSPLLLPHHEQALC